MMVEAKESATTLYSYSIIALPLEHQLLLIFTWVLVRLSKRAKLIGDMLQKVIIVNIY